MLRHYGKFEDSAFKETVDGTVKDCMENLKKSFCPQISQIYTD